LGDTNQTPRKYRAFISYAHADEQWGGWLHRALENYRVPKEIIGRETTAGKAPERLTPVFRDRFDLPAAGNLSDKIQDALDHSAFQIVICSPRSAKSHWVNEEIKLFKKIHGNDRTLAVIIDGNPFASDKPGREQEECFPPALRVLAGPNGDLTEERTEPLAADARPDKDGKSLAISKLAAGLLGVNLDDLVQRETQRKARNARRVAGLSGLIAAAMGLLAIFAFNARDQAEQSRVEANTMRGEAENLIQFMLSDFRDNLEKVGRLDMLDSVGEQALNYYDRQDPEALDADALGRRSQAMLLVGEIDQRRNDLDAALEAYENAAEATGELLQRDPENPDRIFEHAQSVFWIGYIHEKRRDIDRAEFFLRDYLAAAEKLFASDNNNPKWQLELAYATNNLGVLEFRRQNYSTALEYFEEAVIARKSLAKNEPHNDNIQRAYATALSWHAWTNMAVGNFVAASRILTEEIELYKKMLLQDSENYSILRKAVVAYRRLGQAAFANGNMQTNRAFNEARKIAARLIERDPDITLHQINISLINADHSEAAAILGDQKSALEMANRAHHHAEKAVSSGTSDINSNSALILALAVRLDRDFDKASALTLAEIIPVSTSDKEKYEIGSLSSAYKSLANYYTAHNNNPKASALRNEAITSLEETFKTLTTLNKFVLFELYVDNGNRAKAQNLGLKLMKTDLRHPRFMVLMKDLAGESEDNFHAMSSD